MVDDEELCAFATQRVTVVAMVHVACRYREVRPGDYEHIGWEPPTSVSNTHELGRLPATTPGEFVIACRLPNATRA